MFCPLCARAAIRYPMSVLKPGAEILQSSHLALGLVVLREMCAARPRSKVTSVNLSVGGRSDRHHLLMLHVKHPFKT